MTLASVIRPCGFCSGQGPVNERVSYQAGEKPHIENIAAQGQQSPIRKEKGLHRQDGRHDQEPRIRSQKDRPG